MNQTDKAFLNGTHSHQGQFNDRSVTHVTWRLVQWKRAEQGKLRKATMRRARGADILYRRVREDLSWKGTFEQSGMRDMEDSLDRGNSKRKVLRLSWLRYAKVW